MKPKSTHRRLVGAFAAVFGISSVLSQAEITVEGARDNNGPEEYTSVHVQTTSSGWGDSNVLANLHAKQEGTTLFLHLAGSVSGNAVILFLDTKPGGVNSISNNLITSGGDLLEINRLAGLTFESGFGADYAIRVYGEGSNAYVNLYDLSTGVRTYSGNSGTGVITDGIISAMRTIWGTVLPADYATASLGIEMALPLAGLGVSEGENNVAMTAILLNGESKYGSNQLLGSRTGPGDTGSGLTSLNLEDEPGIQTLTFAVQGPPAVLDPAADEDNDGLLNGVETNTGLFVDAGNTGTNPYLPDSDGDSQTDGDEVTGAAFGYVANPNIANYSSMAVPGSFTDPVWKEDGSANNSMSQGSTESLTDQYQWTLDYQFSNFGAIQYKYAANGTWNKNWGLNGGDFTTVIQATGFHRFSFNNATLVQSLTRIVFPDSQSYLAAYGLSAGSDFDGDGINNEAEFTVNTDPTQSDTDGDGLNDSLDPAPFVATRDIHFSVNMSVQEALGNFDPAVDTVVVDFFSGLAADLPDLSLTPVGNGIWSGTLTNFAGPVETAFGTYKFRHNAPGAADGGYEGAIGDRSFNLGAANVTQTLTTVYFNDNSTMPNSGFGTWATQYANGQTAGEDFDGDGIRNGVEYFMGQTTPGFTVNPSIIDGSVTWPRDASATGVTYKVWSSQDLATWTDVTADAMEIEGAVRYTLPTSTTKRFVRLEVEVAAP